jgi:hypothetical protein
VYKILKDAASDFHYLDNLEDRDKDVAISCSSRFAGMPNFGLERGTKNMPTKRRF